MGIGRSSVSRPRTLALTCTNLSELGADKRTVISNFAYSMTLSDLVQNCNTLPFYSYNPYDPLNYLRYDGTVHAESSKEEKD